MTHIVLIGGHGKVARLLASPLVRGGYRATALFRNPDHEEDMIADGATPVVFDIEHTDAISVQCAGHDAVVWSAGADGGVSRTNVAKVIAAAFATPATIGKTVGFVDGQTPIQEALSQLQ
ncbi:NAD(P)H-binding protein [Xanthomonas fragariae]|uniref:Nucleoside-diphosphate sugar epimerase n=1 Tax=Xanthomonas fragariae TaxID=48664 RepID=A0A1Y6GTX4_9XANT|nr:NAD(P)H-binding protein [Xanthomonas fragariae]AOD16459.1 hypothetical protein BER92_02015 [Xanthomonas fragariae]AOD19891.1 hypothetical protein BER93_02015 [Xanthomonas fragariae]MBL9197453.1 NAD(P)H-binding protein [Xanthomonas fragariae]MBL9222590.1 NAD(P)H-binding protein [Xanthomonas fragariae]MDM7555352.1 NAD(P)H-binding protein [Xanthomonas fragariae]